MYPQNVTSHFKLIFRAIVSVLFLLSITSNAVGQNSTADASQETITLTRALPMDTLLFNTVDSILTVKRVPRAYYAEIGLGDKWRSLPHESIAIYVFYRLCGSAIFRNNYYISYKKRNYIFDKNDLPLNVDITMFIKPLRTRMTIVYNEQESINNLSRWLEPIVLVYNCDGTLSHYEEGTEDYYRF